MNIDEWEKQQAGSEDEQDNTENEDNSEDEFLDMDDDDDDDASDEDEDGSEVNPDDSDEDTGSDEQEPEQKQPTKPVQTDEENKRFAEQRRERVVEERLKASPEYQLAQELSKMYGGVPVDQMLQQLRQNQIAKEAQQRQVPVEQVQREYTERETLQKQQAEVLELKNQMEFQAWTAKTDTAITKLKQDYPVLTDADLVQAKLYVLETLKNPDIPIETAVFAIHGTKIANHVKEQARTEALAEISGRKRSALPPQGGKGKTSEGALSRDELQAAKAFGMSEDEYRKWRS